MLSHLVPKEHLEAIGDVVVSHNLLEWYLIHLLSTLSGRPLSELRIFTSEMTSKQIRGAASSFAAKQGRPTKARLQGLLSKHEKLEGHRNLIVHSVWGGSGGASGQVTRIKYSARKELKLTLEENSVETLKLLARNMRELAESYQDLASEIAKKNVE